MEKVSIIVPVYNAAKYLNECIISLLNQDYKDYEIIAVDDGSTDNSLEILKTYNSDKLKIYSKRNGGVSSTRNFGIKKVTGKYLCFCDSDDTLESNYISKLVSHLKNPNDLVIGKYRKISENGNEIYNNCIGYDGNIKFSKLESKKIANLFMNNVLQAVYCKLFKASIINEKKIFFDESINFGEDTKFVLEYLKHIKKICTFDDIIYNYRFNPTSITNSVSTKQANSMLKFKKYFNDFLLNYNFENTEVHNYFYYSTLIDYYYFNINGFNSLEYRKYYVQLKKNSLIRECKSRIYLVKKITQLIPLAIDTSLLWIILCKLRKILIHIKL